MLQIQEKLLEGILKAPIIITDKAWKRFIVSAANEIDSQSLTTLLSTVYTSIVNNPSTSQIIYEVNLENKNSIKNTRMIKIVIQEEISKITVMLPEEK